MFDELTNIGNTKYLETEYQSYLKRFPNANYIMIDLSGFKKINDTYGHEAGDKCLKSFADKLKIFFRDSIIVRLHGDEFSIVTFQPEEKIKLLLELVDLNIQVEVKAEVLPFNFSFNAGSTHATADLLDTQSKADYMMYYAKQHKGCYQPFNQAIFQKKLKETAVITDLTERLDGEKFSYYGRSLFDRYDKQLPFTQIYTKDQNGDNILSGNTYSTLRKNSQITRFDMFNLQNIIGKTSMLEGKENYFINVDYRSLLSVRDLIDFLNKIKQTTINGIDNVILSIDLNGIETPEYPITIEMINMLSNLGFRIRLDKLDMKIADSLVEAVNPGFIKINTALWKAVMDSDKKVELLRYKLYTYQKMGDDVKVIFDQVENETEKKFLHEIAPSDSIYSGNHYSKEKKLTLY